MNPHSTGNGVTSDNIAIYVALLATCVAFATYLAVAFVRRRGGDEPIIGKVARISYFISFGSVGAASLYLMQCILSGNRFDIAYIYENTSTQDGLLYQISSFWAGQGGSMLLWTLMGCLIGLALLRRLGRSAPVLMSFWCLVQTFLLTLMVVDDPLKRLAEFQPGMMGSGLNPLLKNPWMAIHPPVVFLGYALLIVPAAFAIQALIDGDASRWAKKCLPWALGGWVALTAGLVLGMVWSYEVLGWGGYWAWDPVENASLVPWLLGTALVHGLVLQRQRAKMAPWSVLLAFVTFLSVLYATYLTRSGVTAAVSVHAFGDAKSYLTMPLYPWLKWTPIVFSALCLGVLAVRWNALQARGKALLPLSRDFALTLGVVVMCLFALVVIVGTTYTTFNGGKDLDASFYTVMSIPLSIAMAALIAFSTLLKWGGVNGSPSENPALQYGLVALAVVAVIGVISAVLSIALPGARAVLFGWFLSGDRVNSTAAAAVLLVLIGSSAVALVASGNAIRQSSIRRSGAYVAHAGVALIIAGVIFSTSGGSKVLDLESSGRPVSAYGYSFAYSGVEQVTREKQAVRLTATRNGHRFNVPLAFVSTQNGTLFYPYIRSGVLGDLYVSPDKVIADSVRPSITMTDKGWIAHPTRIPRSNATLTILSMQVESHLAKLQYNKPGAKPEQFEVSLGHPVSLDGYTFSFKSFWSEGEKNMMSMNAGVDIGLRGHGSTEVAMIRVARKPLISLLWLGTVLISLGGALAMWRRRSEKAE